MGHRAIDSAKVSTYSRIPSELEKTFYAALIADLIDARKRAGLTQEQLDNRLGVTEGQIAKWEAFIRLPGAFMFTCWAAALGLAVTTTSIASIRRRKQSATRRKERDASGISE